MSPDENKHIVRRFYTEVIGTGNYSNLEDYSNTKIRKKHE